MRRKLDDFMLEPEILEGTYDTRFP